MTETADGVTAEDTWVETPPAQFGQDIGGEGGTHFCGGEVWVLDLATF